MAAATKAAGERPITLHDHIKELRNRFFGVAIIFIVASALAYNYKDTLLYYLLKPLGNEKLIYLNPAGGFSFIFQVTMYVGIAVAVPFLVYNLYRFVVPALPKSAQKHSALVLFASLLLLLAGVSFGYFIAIPGALNFLNHFADGYVIPSLTAESYLNFILAYTAGLGILFQLPLVLMFIHWIHPLKPLGLLKFERYMILIAFVAAAVITPTPDVMNQVILAAPIIIMYQIGFIAVSISILRKRRKVRVLQKAERRQAARLAKKPVVSVSAPVPIKTATPILPPIPDVVMLKKTATPASLIPIAVKSKQVNMTAVQPSTAIRRTMDIMVPSTHTHPVARPVREAQLRPAVMPLKVPVRSRTAISGNGMAAIDGVSIIY